MSSEIASPSFKSLLLEQVGPFILKLLRRIFLYAMMLVLLVVLLSFAWVYMYRFSDPLPTYLMRQDEANEREVKHQNIPYGGIAKNLKVAVITAEDQNFCSHGGFDWVAIATAYQFNEEHDRTRGASTISMQMVKNVFLWPDRTWMRKGFEAYLTLLVEWFWPKQRILELYLNVAEWDRGVYGAEAAAQHYFGVSAGILTPYQSALLAAALPTPRRSNPAEPTRYLRRRAGDIMSQMDTISIEFGECL